MGITTRTVIYVEILLQRAGQPVGVNYSENQTLLRRLEYRYELNISKDSRFHIPKNL